MQRKALLFVVLVGTIAFVSFYEAVFQPNAGGFFRTQPTQLAVQTTPTSATAIPQTELPESIEKPRTFAGEPEVSDPQQNEREHGAPQEIIHQSSSSHKSYGDETETSTIPTVLTQEIQTDHEIPASDAHQEPANNHRFVKIDASGKPLADDADHWACVYDTKTNLLWEIDAGMPHQFRYRWSQDLEVNDLQIDSCPYFSGKTTGDVDSCTTSLRVVFPNSMNFCGSSTWHLPSVSELESLVVPGQYNPAINIKYFPHIQSDYYWTREGFAYSEFDAWAINFAIGKVNDVAKVEFMFVRLVSGGEANNDL